MLAGAEANIFMVGDPDQAIYQFRGASSEAFMLFVRQFPALRGWSRWERTDDRWTPILQCAFGIVNENPAVFADKGSAIGYRRTPLESWRDERG